MGRLWGVRARPPAGHVNPSEEDERAMKTSDERRNGDQRIHTLRSRVKTLSGEVTRLTRQVEELKRENALLKGQDSPRKRVRKRVAAFAGGKYGLHELTKAMFGLARFSDAQVAKILVELMPDGFSLQGVSQSKSAARKGDLGCKGELTPEQIEELERIAQS